MLELAIQKGVITKANTNDPAQKSRFYILSKVVRDFVKRFNIPFYDACCPDASTGLPSPVGYDSGLKFYNGTAWVAASETAFGDGTVSDLAIKFGADGNNGFYGVSDTQLGVAVEGVLVAGANTTGLFTGNISEQVTNAGVTVDGVLLKDGGVTANSQIAGFYPQAVQNDIAAGVGGAIPVTNHVTTINTDIGGDAFTLAAGTQIGQLKKIRLVTDGGGDGVVTATLVGGTTITFNDTADFVLLQWNGTAWAVLENSGTTIA